LVPAPPAAEALIGVDPLVKCRMYKTTTATAKTPLKIQVFDFI
jgi:hypothetical protein